MDLPELSSMNTAMVRAMRSRLLKLLRVEFLEALDQLLLQRRQYTISFKMDMLSCSKSMMPKSFRSREIKSKTQFTMTKKDHFLEEDLI